MRHFYIFFLIGCIFFTANVSHAAGNKENSRSRAVLVSDGKEYVEANFPDLVRASALFGGVSIKEQVVLDEYAQIFYCQIYRDYFQNDLEWINISKAIQKSFQKEKDTIPHRYFFQTDIFIDRYDAKSESFPMAKEYIFHRVGLLEFFSETISDHYCGRNNFSFLPMSYAVRIRNPLDLYAINAKDKDILKKISDVPLWGGGIKKLRAVFFITLEGFDEKVKSVSNYHLIFSGHLDKMAIYTDSSLNTHIQSIRLSDGKK